MPSDLEQAAEDTIAQMGGALCDVIANALIERGINPIAARALAERACKPTARKVARDVVQTSAKRVKRARSAYSKKYKTAFNKLAGKYKLKNGKWRKGGFRKAVKEAHRMVKK